MTCPRPSHRRPETPSHRGVRWQLAREEGFYETSIYPTDAGYITEQCRTHVFATHIARHQGFALCPPTSHGFTTGAPAFLLSIGGLPMLAGAAPASAQLCPLCGGNLVRRLQPLVDDVRGQSKAAEVGGMSETDYAIYGLLKGAQVTGVAESNATYGSARVREVAAAIESAIAVLRN